jgi:5-hydroxyisourate hydrolase-like protein (transthyretin family)
VVEADRQQPLAGHMLDTTMSTPGAQVSVQVADRLSHASVVGSQHGSAGGRVTEAVEDRDTLGRPQDHIEGRHGVAAMSTAE